MDERRHIIVVECCPLCGGSWRFYEGSLGYETLICTRCRFDINAIKIHTGPELPEEEQARRGSLMAQVFCMTPDPDEKGRFLTGWGIKSPLGIYRTAKRIINQGE